jgi:hypothetical protein
MSDNRLRAINQMTTGEAAVVYMRLGLPVLPCWADEKVPATQHGVKDARCTLRDMEKYLDVKRRFERRGFNVAIATGSPVSVLDVDVKNGAPGMESLRRIRAMRLVEGAVAQVLTPSGGVHLYFPSSQERNGALPRAGLDHRGDGGYVVAPPSIVGGRCYAWQFSRNLAEGAPMEWEQIRRVVRGQRRPRKSYVASPYGTQSLRRWLSRQPEGNRNNGLYWAARRAIEMGEDPRELAEVANQIGLGWAEIDATLASALGASR